MAALLTSPDGPNDEDYKRILERIEGIMEGYMRSSTHMVNELARIRKHHREDKNEVVDEMCRQHKENINQFRRFRFCWFFYWRITAYEESNGSISSQLQHGAIKPMNEELR